MNTVRILIGRLSAADEVFITNNTGDDPILVSPHYRRKWKDNDCDHGSNAAEHREDFCVRTPPYNLEQVFVCDQHLVRTETYRKVVDLPQQYPC